MKENRQAQLLGILLWSQSLFVGTTFRSLPLIASATGLVTLLIALRLFLNPQNVTRGVQKVKRWWKTPLACFAFLSLFIAMATWRSTTQISEELNYVYLVIDSLAHTSMSFSLLLWLRSPTRGHSAMIPFGCIVALMSCAAGGASSSLTAQSAIALTICIGFVLGCEIILKNKHGFQNVASGNPSNLIVSRWLAPTFSLLVLSLLLMGTSGIANGTSMILPTIQSKLQEELQTSFNAMAEESYVGGTRYVRGSELGSIRQHMLGDPNDIAVQAFCDLPPGYLRGSAFDIYFRGRWIDSGSYEFERYTQQPKTPDRQILPTSPGTQELNVPTRQPLNRFVLEENAPERIISLEVLSDPSKGSIIFTPLNSFWMEASSQELSLTAHRVIRTGIDVRRPYVIGVGQELPPMDLLESIKESTQQVPSRIQSELSNYANGVIGDSETTRDIAKSIAQHFQTDYGYSLTYKPDRPRSIDPLLYFLREQHDAHCEYFASATVMLLRSLGIHARYVTGYIVDEMSDEENTRWLGRNRDAHAWAEAYDEESKQWFPVESTPGRRYTTLEPDKRDLNLADDNASLLQDQIGLDDGWLRNSIDWILSIRLSEPIVLLIRFTQLPLFVVLSLYLWKRNRRQNTSIDEKEELLARKMLRKTDRLVMRLNLLRAPSETLWQFSDRIRLASTNEGMSEPQKQFLNRCADWYKQFASARYQGKRPQSLQK